MRDEKWRYGLLTRLGLMGGLLRGERGGVKCMYGIMFYGML